MVAAGAGAIDGGGGDFGYGYCGGDADEFVGDSVEYCWFDLELVSSTRSQYRDEVRVGVGDAGGVGLFYCPSGGESEIGRAHV